MLLVAIGNQWVLRTQFNNLVTLKPAIYVALNLLAPIWKFCFQNMQRLD